LSDVVKPWMCRGGHVLGMVRRNGSGVRQLLLYRQALGQDGEGEVDVMAVVDGLVMDVRCSVCGRVRTWVPSKEALER